MKQSHRKRTSDAGKQEQKRSFGDLLFLLVIAPVTGLIGFSFILLLRSTIRFQTTGFSHFSKRKASRKNLVVCLWHNQLLFMPFMWSGRWGGAHAIVSRSRDGERIAAILRFFGIGTIRGSSTRGGTSVLRQVLAMTKAQESSFFVTPDGPTGPPFKVKDGAAFLAYNPEVPVYCMSVMYGRCRILGSWDRFLLPMPFSKAYFVCSPPLYLGRSKEYSVRSLEVEKGLHIVNEVAMALSLSRIRPEEADAILEKRFGESIREEFLTVRFSCGTEEQKGRKDS
ncbi:MAG: uncharacterized protein C75L2_00080007 [Leptospirillum sp. Group II 'C75']|jgi:lysophospholipid acyltransferase (LPLAT)-like uncharacterized protein|uniref:DUF374 domain-containing protein n=1 Tax=Leptospirillum ferriphilum TaxID=178606 RepID=A0A1V3SSH2_9BACT|nr:MULTISPECIES: lysophospholipid acyltransferase family protein [Leptospirillum]AKS22621.1 hypothetical protein ABH19_00945 [Leptospirillum sp. Group II 'CF-1']EAY57858.1 MAG: conserved protein of unknown function [Leptospirillum rubarum]EIJ75990.1 MAG: uncharacterized protein C75L2_00080007 [Leptospirillum sp. Group II 'C75']OOH69646.1 hypothetical protein BOX24_11505 [Leptospirillum ferriphilum]